MKTCLLLLLASAAATSAADFAAFCADRAAIERLYYEHRLGTKPPFAEVLPPAVLEQLVRLDLRKEAALRETYGVTLTPAQIAAEVHRINTTTQAPDMLAEIKAALGHDPEKFARVFAKPILVERELRRRFDRDDALHTPQRREMERVRATLTNAAAAFRASPGNEALTEQSAIRNPPSATYPGLLTPVATNHWVGELLNLLKRGHPDQVLETTWHFGARPEERPAAPTADEIEIKKRFGPNAQILSSPHAAPGQERKFYFEDLPAELQPVVRAQLRRAGDVSEVIEMPGGFLLYLARDRTTESLAVAVLSLRKRSYEEWLAKPRPGDSGRH